MLKLVDAICTYDWFLNNGHARIFENIFDFMRLVPSLLLVPILEVSAYYNVNIMHALRFSRSLTADLMSTLVRTRRS